uniref:Uncharacterized protein n=1 Tax=Heterorhabditis bacteriophora TaxID=37862 RepID=A0A1I7X6T5_HETBA
MSSRSIRSSGITHQNSPQRDGRDRDRRLFANIQSTLRGTSSASSPSIPLSEKLKPRVKDPVEVFILNVLYCSHNS